MAAPPGLASRTLGRLRRELAHDDVEIAAGDHGRDVVSTAVLAQIARRAATTVDAVHRVSVVVRVLPAGPGADDRPDAGRDDRPDAGRDDLPGAGPHVGVAIDVHLTASLGPSLPRVADRVRAAIFADVEAVAGVRATRVDVTVDDVL